MESLAGRVILLSGWRRSFVAFVAGSLAALAQPHSTFCSLFCGISHPRLASGWSGGGREGLRALAIPAFKTGWWFGFGYFLLGLWWIGNALLVDAENFAWAVPLAVVGLPAFLAVFYGIATLLARLLWSGGVLRIVSLAFAFGIAELIRSIIFTGFPGMQLAMRPCPLYLACSRLRYSA